MLLLNIPELIMLLVQASKGLNLILSVICISSITLVFNFICALIYLKDLLCSHEGKINNDGNISAPLLQDNKINELLTIDNSSNDSKKEV